MKFQINLLKFYMEITGRAASRRIFVQYLFSQHFKKEEDIDQLIDFISTDKDGLSYNSKFLDKLNNIYETKKELIHNTIDELTDINIENVKYTIILAALTELFLNDVSLVISEYLKITDAFEIQSAFVHKFIDESYKILKPHIDPIKTKEINSKPSK